MPTSLNPYKIGSDGRDLSAQKGEVLNEVGTVHRLCSRLLQASGMPRRGPRPRTGIGTSSLEAHALAGLGRCALAAGDTAKAEDRLRQALEIFQRIGAAEATGVSAELEALAESQPTA